MSVPKNSDECAICQMTFNDPLILINHVEFRHSSTGSIKTNNLESDPLELPNDKTALLELMPIHDNVVDYTKQGAISEREDTNEASENSSTVDML